MKGQMFLISAVLIIVFLVTIFAYLSISQSYNIQYKYTKRYLLNWKVNSTSRFVYTVYGFGNSKIIKLDFPYNFSSLTVFTTHPVAWQKDGNTIYVASPVIASQHKTIYFYVNGTNYNFEPIYGNNSKYYLITYFVDLPNLVTYGGDKISFNCYSINSTGPIFIKFCDNYAFNDFVYANDNFNITASELKADGITYSCDGIERTFNSNLLVFVGNYSIELINFNGTINCTNDTWQVHHSSPVYIYISPFEDDYVYSNFGKYTYSISYETVDGYFNSVLASYGVPYNGRYNCITHGGLDTPFGDLRVNGLTMKNNFIEWNTTTLYYDGIQLQNGNILVDGSSPKWISEKDSFVAESSSCNISFRFFNMSPVIYVTPSGLCNLTLPFGNGTVTYSDGNIVIKNQSYQVMFTGDILSNSSFPTLYVSGPFYISIYRLNYVTPYFYEFNSYCPRIV